MMANKHPSNSCPECGSTIYLRKNERSDANRECGECGAQYHRRLQGYERARLREEEM